MCSADSTVGAGHHLLSFCVGAVSAKAPLVGWLSELLAPVCSQGAFSVGAEGLSVLEQRVLSVLKQRTALLVL